MMQKILLDTNIYLDFYLDRKDNLKPLGEFAFRLIKETVSCKYMVLITDYHFIEIKNSLNCNIKDIWKRILDSLNKSKKIKEIIPTDREVTEAKEISRLKNLPFGDCLFAVVAKNNNAKLVTRDRHFNELDIQTYLPEDLI